MEKLAQSCRAICFLSFLGSLLISGCGTGDQLSPEDSGVLSQNGLVEVESEAELRRMQEHVRSLYDQRDVHHSFSLLSGDIVDCVDKYRQPGMRRPGMEDHVILQPPPPMARPANLQEDAADNTTPVTAQQEIFLKGDRDESGAVRSCPNGTVPIRRIATAELMRFKNLGDFHRKYPGSLQGAPTGVGAPALGPPGTANIPPALGPNALHQYAHAAQYNLTNYGAHSRFNLWKPYVQVSSEFSLSQLWVTRGSGSSLETLEVGWQVFSGKYGDSNARLFIYSTSDGYSGNNYASGCYNLDCGRFVQTSSSVVIGGKFANYSVTGGAQHEFEAAFLRTGSPAAWWLYIAGQPVGYYPLNLFDFNGILNQASTIDFGGEIIDDRTKHAAHTTTDMGSGAYPSAGYGFAAYQSTLWYFNTPTTALHATGITPMRDNAFCYDISPIFYDANWGAYFYFGGPGYNINCQ
jgi:hypothetical protein